MTIIKSRSCAKETAARYNATRVGVSDYSPNADSVRLKKSSAVITLI